MNTTMKRMLAALLAALCLMAAMAVAEDAEPALEIDATQTKYTDAPIATATPVPGEEVSRTKFVMYSIGDVFQAATGSGTAKCDVRNVPHSTHDIQMRWYITGEELAAHGLSTEGLQYPEEGAVGRWPIAETGLFEPGYHITEVQLLPLRDGTPLPAGEYHLLLAENYYHHITGEKYPYESVIPITLIVQG